MPLAAYSTTGEIRLGKVFGDRLIDIASIDPDFPRTIKAFLEAGDTARAAFDRISESDGTPIPLRDVTLHAPIPDPEKYLAIGLNYADHGAEANKLGMATPEYQIWFNKQVSCITGPYSDVVAPKVSDKLDYEGELAVVIGKTCRNVPADKAREVIGGYMVSNDVSARDWQFRTTTITLGKSFDTHGPTGPWLTLDSEIEDPHALGLRTYVNGEERQHGNTSDLIHDIHEQIAYLSQVMTLKPGDILATGTPAGVGVARDPQVFLQPGDVVRVEIDGLGHIENTITAES
ncbi:fumarylacetoacetate hydrolase family protein [Paracoccus siganidrum]|uniref:Fumarylacetoacetate hydrolase family protein n=1 Tax=Paracoccus siganidrum TaxID=1276757 RepID=A0A419A6R7_9RHOB|nr:fumarylacetoacetate hydrolase family protein [Paracoccus siganidrum]RJL14826.1 fumarylacetoacetate hydrolase family protein [Paracoccus siganidrum]RMC30004.1 5-carboxymethyl-2-hydroxymuconate isomerase [Paracoccus siganidrum]